jgi:hypothetical protein
MGFDESDQSIPVTGEYVAAVGRVRRLLRTSWDPDGALVMNAAAADAYEEQSRHLASLTWMGESPERMADYLASGAIETPVRPHLTRDDLVALARTIIQLAAPAPPSA